MTAYSMKLKPDRIEALRSNLSDEWQTAREISNKAGVAFNRACLELSYMADRGQVEFEFRRHPKKTTTVMVYKRKSS